MQQVKEITSEVRKSFTKFRVSRPKDFSFLLSVAGEAINKESLRKKKKAISISGTEAILVLHKTRLAEVHKKQASSSKMYTRSGLANMIP